MAERQVGPRVVEDRKLTCHHCGYDQFWTRKALLNTRALTFFDLDWANRRADNYVCDRCGFVTWFLPKK